MCYFFEDIELCPTRMLTLSIFKVRLSELESMVCTIQHRFTAEHMYFPSHSLSGSQPNAWEEPNSKSAYLWIRFPGTELTVAYSLLFLFPE